MKNKIDKTIYEEFLKLPTINFHGAVKPDAKNLKEQRRQFFINKKLPQFSYSRARRIPLAKYRRALDEFEGKIERLSPNSVVADLYHEKIDELRTRADLIEAICLGDDQGVTALSKSLYPNIVQSATELNKEFNEMLRHAKIFHVHQRPINARLFTKMMRLTLDHYGMNKWRIGSTSKSSIHIKHGKRQEAPMIRVPKHLSLSRARAARVLTHEIEVHALRTFNGAHSSLLLLGRGLAHYSLTEEGLAIYFQSLLAKKTHQHLPGFWDAWTVALMQKNNFEETFEIIKDARTKLAKATGLKHPEKVGADTAWRLCRRAYRGITNLNQSGVGFVRDHIYRSGNIMIKKALQEKGGKILPTLFAGNLGLEHLEKITSLNLPRAQVPEFVSKAIVNQVMREEKSRK